MDESSEKTKPKQSQNKANFRWDTYLLTGCAEKYCYVGRTFVLFWREIIWIGYSWVV
ncbi:MAG: hypothetical protein ACYS80_24540 [Planctomycetota bacterium]